MIKRFLTLLLFIPSLAFADNLRGTVVKVLDGDTVKVQTGEKLESVRVLGIDAPERNEPFYRESKAAAKQLVMGKEVLLKTRGRDKRGRLIAFVIVDRKSLGLELLREGLAVVYWQYPPQNERTKKRYLAAQAGASLSSPPKGIWTYRRKSAK